MDGPIFQEQILKTQCSKIIDFWNSWARGVHNIMLSGPVQSSKTTPILLHILRMHLHYPNFKSLILRTKYTDIKSSIIPTLFDQILELDHSHAEQPFSLYGGLNAPQKLIWKNGGVTEFRGADSHRSHIMGAEYDLIFYNQIEDSPEQIIDDIAARTMGRAGNWVLDNGEKMYQFIADANPSTDFHHVMEKKRTGWWDEWYDIMHDSNPQLFYNGKYLPYGIKVLTDLNKTYTGVQHRRKVLGEWCSGEGLVYSQYNPEIHDIECDRNDFGSKTKWYLGSDFGDVTPHACGLYAVTGGKKILFKEIYHTYPTVDEFCVAIRAMLDKYEIPKIETAWVDHLESHYNKFRESGFPAVKANKDILQGIEEIRILLRDEKLLFNVDSLDKKDESLAGRPARLTDELKSYQMKSREDQMKSTKPDHPAEKQHDHACDHLRYFCMGVRRTGSLTTETGSLYSNQT